VSKDPIDNFRTHLEFLGYNVEVDLDDWSTATHSRRFNFYFRADSEYLRIICQVDLGATADLAWHHDALVALNALNENARLTCYTIARLDDGDWVVRMRALLPPSYSRESYGLLMDLWHDEQERISQLPRVAPAGDGGNALH
jgi:hypothetical protein